MTKPLTTVFIAGLGLAALALTACGDGLSVDKNPRIEIQVNEESLTFEDDAAEVSFGQALQLPVTYQVRVLNPGNEPLVISSIDWKANPDTGGQLVNPYVALELGASLPIEIAADGADRLTFQVRYTPPLGGALDDFSPSVLVFESNATDYTGRRLIPALEVTFSMPTKRAAPVINPPSFIFRNATPTKPETQTFCVENDVDLGTQPFTVNDVRLLNPSNVFILKNLPNAGSVVGIPTEPNYVPACFDVEYRPTGAASDQKSNVVEVVTSEGNYTVNISADVLLGNYSLSYSHVNKFDFTNVPATESRRVIVVSEGPGPLLVKEPSIEPPEARTCLSWKAFLPATGPSDPETEVCSSCASKFPRSLASGRTIEFEITYDPGMDPTTCANGSLVIPVAYPDPAEIELDLFGGTPKPLMNVAPPSDAVLVSADVSQSENGVGHVVIYNDGNGDLQVNDVVVKGKFIGQDPEVFSLPSKPAMPLIVSPGGLHVLEVGWTTGPVAVGDEGSEQLEISYVEGVTGSETTANLSLFLFDSAAKTLPTAAPAAIGDAVAGEIVGLDASGSSPGSGAFDGQYCFWYLTAKPDGSRAKLNEVAGPQLEFLPDAAGTYTIELVVFASHSDGILYSRPASFDLTVAAP